MKAAVYHRYGPPEVIGVAEIARPDPRENEVRIKVIATTVNRTDCGFRSAEYFVSRFFSGLFRPKFPVLGNEFAGVIDAVGSAVTLFRVGQNVFGYNDSTFGAHAEYMIMPENGAMATIPENFDLKNCAPLTEGAHYALCDIRAAKVTAGQHVLVYGATGAIGSAAVQLLKYVGARVTAVCATPHVELVRSIGADVVVDYTTRDFTDTPDRYDFVFDAVGKSSFGQCKPVMKEKGIYISTELGKRGENVFYALVGVFQRGKKVLFPLPTISTEDVILLKELAESDKFRPVIDRHYRLDQIVEAHRYVETGQKVGNVIITIE